MTATNGRFGVNTYSYTFAWQALDCVRHLADQGYAGVELMMYPGHLWPDLDTAGCRALRQAAEACGVRIVTLNMPNVDINVAGASEEMRAYSLALVARFVQLAGELGAPGIVIGPGKANPLFPAPTRTLEGFFFRALDHLAPLAAVAGTRLLLENMPFAFLPDAAGMMRVLDEYGDDRIGMVYDLANGHFIGEDLAVGLRLMRRRLALVHLSDTYRTKYRHDPVGTGDVPFASVPAVLHEIGYRELPMLEVISGKADADIRDSAARLTTKGF